MHIEALGPGAVHPLAEHDAVFVLPVAFHLDERRGHQLGAVRVIEASLDSGASLLRAGAVEVHPHGRSSAAIRFPVHLRPPVGSEAGANQLDLHLPIRRPTELRRVESGRLEVTFELDRQAVVTYEARFQWWTDNATIDVETFSRVGSPLPLHLKIAGLFLLPAGLALWNVLENDGVEATREVVASIATPDNVDRFVFFLVGLFGIHLVGAVWSSIRSWLSYWRLPELYLNPALVAFLRSPASTIALLAAFSLFAAGAYWLRSVPMEKPDRDQSWWREGDEVFATRVHTRNVDGLLLAWEDQLERPMAKGVVSDGSRRVVPEYIQYEARVIGGGDLPASCPTWNVGDQTVGFRFSAADDFSDPCLEPFRREVRNLFCGRDWRRASYRVSWDGSRAVEIEALGSVDEGTLLRLIKDVWRPAFAAAHKGAEAAGPPDALTMARAAKKALGGRPIPWSAFVAVYDKQMSEILTKGTGEALSRMASWHVLLELYRLAPGEPIPVTFVERLSGDLPGQYSKLKLVDKNLFRAHLRFLLALEHELGEGPAAQQLGSTIQDLVQNEGYDIYMMLLEESVRTAQRYGGSCRTSASRERYRFVVERLRAIAHNAPGHSRALWSLHDELDSRRASFAEELAAIGSLLTAVQPSMVSLWH